MKTKLLVFILVSLPVMLSAQTTWEYTYDNAGNRIQRQVIEMKHKPYGTWADSSATEQTLCEMSISIMPNPTAGRLVMQITNLPEGAEGYVGLWDAQARQVYYTEIIKAENVIEMGNQPGGVYVLQLKVNGKKTEWKVVRE